MGILKIQPVVRGESKVLLAFAGPSGTGKTLTALLVARGMVKKPEEIGFLDTENGRGSFYADKLDGQFQYAILHPPFSPDRYGSAIKEFQEIGVKVLVIDSISHEWEGIGGCEDIANAPKSDGSVRKIADWVKAKNEHRTKFMNALMYSDMHIICCVRAREKTDFKDITKPVSLGIQPVCEKNFMFEMMASVMFENEGKNQKAIKIPNYLKDAFGTGQSYLGQETGKKIIEWVKKGEAEHPDVTKARGELLIVCESGLDALRSAWLKLPKHVSDYFKLKKEVTVFEESAKAFDAQKEPQTSSDSQNVQKDRIKESISKITKDITPLELESIDSICKEDVELSELFNAKKQELGL
jgi:hypothetical protein